tara:strand:+ start:64403 stop:65515 length:1113 start_codon:yes stop_codon:yes gene_type:complete
MISYGHAQNMVQSENIGDCSGAVSINKQEEFKAEFTGKAGYNNDVAAYEDRLDFEPFNTFWLKVESQVSGNLSISFKDLPESTEIALFSAVVDSSCNAIQTGQAHLESVVKLEQKNVATLASKVEKGFRYFVYLNSKKEGTPAFSITTSFLDERSQKEVDELMKVKDLRSDRSAAGFSVHILDQETLLPVETSIVVKNTKSYNALYSANVIRFPDSEYLSFDMEINAPGYFFKDISVNRRNIKSDTLAVQLKPIRTDDQIELEGLQFESESDVLLESAKNKIRRLRDFLALNKTVNIEVIGHVHKEGRNSWKAKRLSKKRAKKVKSFLVDSGINEDRISIVGMGNEQMKYPEPENDKQIQANRRVEIKIK